MQHEWRVIQLAGVHNFRDYGGYAVSGGGHLRRGMLWRSGQHHDATDADLARIAALGLTAVFDLRFDVERASHPCRRHPDFRARVFFADELPAQSPSSQDGAMQAAPHVVAAQKAGTRDAAAMRATMTRAYTTIPFRPNQVAAMQRYFAELAQLDTPSLIHCMAGKDRTGVAVAMLHRAMGVHRDDVMTDFLITNTVGDAEARIVAGGRVMAARAGPLDPEALRVVMSVEPEYLDTAFATITERYGSEDAYLAMLGLDKALRERLRDRLVV